MRIHYHTQLLLPSTTTYSRENEHTQNINTFFTFNGRFRTRGFPGYTAGMKHRIDQTVSIQFREFDKFSVIFKPCYHSVFCGRGRGNSYVAAMAVSRAFELPCVRIAGVSRRLEAVRRPQQIDNGDLSIRSTIIGAVRFVRS